MKTVVPSIGKRLDKYLGIVSVMVFLCLWQLIGQLGYLPKFILPTPVAIIQALVEHAEQLAFHAQITVLETLVGLFYGGLIAWLLAIMMDRYRLLYHAIYPFLVVSQTIPTVALAPILLLWFGYGMLPKVVLITLTTTFPIVVAILDGFRHTDKDTIQLLQLMSASPWQILWHVKIPTSLTYFYAGLRVSVSYAVITAVVSEWLGGFEGLGVYMIRSKKLFQYDTMFAIIVLISLISLVAMRLVDWSEPYVMKWKYVGEKNEKENI